MPLTLTTFFFLILFTEELIVRETTHAFNQHALKRYWETEHPHHVSRDSYLDCL